MSGSDGRTIMWERRAAFVATTGLVLALILALSGYIFLLAIDRATGTLDNLASLAIGAVAGATSGTAATALAARRYPSDPVQTNEETVDGEPVRWPPDLPPAVMGFDERR